MLAWQGTSEPALADQDTGGPEAVHQAALKLLQGQAGKVVVYYCEPCGQLFTISRIHAAWRANGTVSVCLEKLYTFEKSGMQFSPSVITDGKVRKGTRFVRVLGDSVGEPLPVIQSREVDRAYLYTQIAPNVFKRLTDQIDRAGMDGHADTITLPDGLYNALTTFSYRYFYARAGGYIELQKMSAYGDYDIENGMLDDETDTLQVKSALPYPIVYPPATKAPAFDCSKAGTKVEKAICQSEFISKLDREMSDYYEARVVLSSHLDDEGTFLRHLKSKQKKWIETRNSVCSEAKAIEPCLIEHYLNRIDQLQRNL